MISEDDARSTVELEDRYAILAPFLEARNQSYEKVGAKAVDGGFRYASDTNTDWLSDKDLRRLVVGL